jgi:hypothetical protein
VLRVLSLRITAGQSKTILLLFAIPVFCWMKSMCYTFGEHYREVKIMKLYTVLLFSSVVICLSAFALGGCDGGGTTNSAEAPRATPPSVVASATVETAKSEKSVIPKAAVAEKAAGAAKGAGAVEGECIQGDHRFSVEPIAAPIVRGTQTEVKLKFVPGDGYKINTKFPWKLTAQANDAIELAETPIPKDAIVLAEAAATIPLSLTPPKSGKFPLKAVAGLSVCNEERCEIIRGQCVSVDVTVQ